MTIAEMHVWFRQYAQQMGMQNVRAILPEQIDLVINSSITDTVNQIITQNIGITNDRIITDNSKIGQINALRSLYKVKIVDTTINPDLIGPEPGNPFSLGDEAYIERIYGKIADFNNSSSRYYAIVSETISGEEVYNAVRIPKDTFDSLTDKVTVTSLDDISSYETVDYNGYGIELEATENQFDYLYLVDLSLNYRTVSNKVTNYFPVRLIDDIYLADTLNDFVLRPRFRTPIAVVYNNQLDLYIDVLEGTDGNKHLPQGLNTNNLRVSYIGKPAKVQYLSDIDGVDVNCDLPDYLHVDILKHAVDLYRISVQGGMYSAQQQQQAQNQEIARNNVRPDNEGYQS
ncbi:MAG: hypothetical protein J6Y28_09670 [Acholeplasmatales bacterium]|nr:hypothetical protein [Methanobrevibacter sp.]MBP5446426.1 hypothetical protein [Acholeplasmatales bacterium]